MGYPRAIFYFGTPIIYTEKMRKIIFALATVAALVVGCQEGAKKTDDSAAENQENTLPNDPHSYAQPNTAVVSHLDLALDVDFDNKQLSGTATWTIAPNHGEEIIFDTYDLDIQQVTVDGDPAKFKLGNKHKLLGQPLHIAIPADAKQVAITYATTPGARALQWLDPEQTGGKKLPFLFTQSQAILARTWIPCQDSPGIRYSYNADVTVPSEMLALMSASNPQEKNAEGQYNFEMEIPIPSYLMALSVGDIQFKAMSDRTGVYAEPDMLEKAAWEFAETEEMVQKAEALYGPYIWGRYDVLVLPPSFPFGGMENPRLTFATPTVVVGDRSQTALIAHELAHSWSGNLVTNATWADFWLNEGFTVYFEMRIMEAVYGRDYSEMNAGISHQDMEETVSEMMANGAAEETALRMKKVVPNPDDGVSAIAYDKGYHFLRLCEETIGRERWDAFLKNYFTSNKFKSMTTQKFIDHLQTELTEDEIAAINLDEWIYGTGIPANCPKASSPRFAMVDSVRTLIIDGAAPNFPEITDNWSTNEWLHFIRGFENPSVALMRKLDRAYGFTATQNAEIMAAWLQPTLRAVPANGAENDALVKTEYSITDNTYYPSQVEAFLVKIGRRKFLTPTYKALVESGQKDWAIEIYKKARPNYHAVSRETMDNLLDFHPEK